MSDTYKTIVIGTSLSEASDEIVRIGVAVALATDSLPCLVHAYPLPVGLPELGPLSEEWIEEYEQTLRQRLAEQAERTGLLRLPGFSADRLRLAPQPTAGEIVRLARQVEADLIVVGATEGRNALPPRVGSTAEGVVQQAPCPVLVVRPELAFPPVQVEIPVDLSPISANALRQGMDFLAHLGGKLAETEALFVLSPLEVASSRHFSPEQIERFALSELHLFLEAHAGDLGHLGDFGEPKDRFGAQQRTGHPWEEVLHVLGERNTDLVILGTHGCRGYDRHLLGSTAARVLHGAPCNLLVVPPDARLRAETSQMHGEQLFGGDWNFVFEEGAGAVNPPEGNWAS